MGHPQTFQGDPGIELDASAGKAKASDVRYACIRARSHVEPPPRKTVA